MTNRRLMTGLGILFVIVATTAWAGPVGVTLRGGTTGLGGDVTVNLGPYFNARAGYGMWNIDLGEYDLDEADVDGELGIKMIPLVLDWHCFGGGFRISGGMAINNNEIDLTATPNEVITFNGTDYTIGTLSGEVSWGDQAWYLGIGFGNACGEEGRFHFACDIGVMIMDDLEAEVDTTALNPALQASLDADVQEEVEAFEDDANDYPMLWPVITVGVSYAF